MDARSDYFALFARKRCAVELDRLVADMMASFAGYFSGISMQSFEFQRTIERFFGESEKFQPFITVVSELAKAADGMTDFIKRISLGGSSQNDGAAHLHNHLARVHQATSSISQRQFFKALEHFQSALSQFQPAQSQNSDLIPDLRHEIERFSDLYDVFITNGSGVNALPVILAARDLNNKFLTLMGSLQMVDEFVGNHDIAGSAEAALAIWLPAHFDLGDFARRLLAVQGLYSELCMLLSVSESEHPLRVSKIESGSLWAKLFGESRVIGLLVSFVQATASWMYRNFTAEGKVSAIPLKIEAIDALLGLTSRLKEAGINTSEMEAHIEKSAFKISRDLTALLDGQASITVNDKTISAGAELTKAISQQAMTPRIGSSGNDTPTGESSLLAFDDANANGK